MEVLAMLVVFGSIAFVSYLFLTGRHKERMALIENDKDMSILRSSPKIHASWALKFGLLLLFAGGGILLGNLMSTVLSLDEEVAIPSFLFMSAGSGLLVFYFLSSNILKNQD